MQTMNNVERALGALVERQVEKCLRWRL